MWRKVEQKMTKAKIRLYLDTTVDFLQKVNTGICHSGIDRKNALEICEDIVEIQRLIFLLDNKIKGLKFNEQQ